MWAEAKAFVRTSISYPVGRAVQAAVCRTAEAGAIPARDSILSGISVERHTPVFQTGVEGALPSCPSISGRDVLPHVPNLGLRSNAALPWFSRDAKSRCRSGLHRSGRGGSTPPSCREWVASIAAMQRSLKPQSTGQHRGNHHFRIRGEIYYHPPLRTESLQVGVLPDAPIHAALAQQKRRPAQNGKVEGANPSRGTISPT